MLKPISLYPSFFLMVGILLATQVALAVAADPILVTRPTLNIAFTWKAATGDPEFYNVRLSDNGVTSLKKTGRSLSSYAFTATDGHTYRIQVQAADSLGNKGPWSVWSRRYTISLSDLLEVGVQFVPGTWYTDWLPPNPAVGYIQCVLGQPPADYAVGDIDRTTIQLNHTVSPFYTTESSGWPGFSTGPVLLVYFPRQAATASLEGAQPGTYTAAMTGKFKDGAAFEGKMDITLDTLPAAPTRPLPEAFSLGQNYPNAFNPETWIPYALPKAADVVIQIYDVSGRLIRRLALGYQAAGYYDNRESAAHWDGRNQTGERLPSGIYFYRLQAGEFAATRKMILHK